MIGILLIFSLSLIFWLWFENKYEDFIRNYALSEINKRLKVPVSAKSAELHFWSTFPRASLVIKNIQIDNPKGNFSKFGNGSSGFAQIGRFEIQFAIIDIIRGNPVIKKIQLREFCFAFQELEDERNNYDILRSDSTSDHNLSLKLENVSLLDGVISFENRHKSQFYQFDVSKIEGKGNFSKQGFSLDIATDLNIQKLISDSIDFGNGKSLKANWSIKGIANTKEISSNNCLLEDIPLKANGKLVVKKNKNILNLNLMTDGTTIQEVLSLFPPAYSKWRGDYIGDGQIRLKSSINWRQEKNHFQSTTILSIKKTALQEKKSGIQAKNISTELSWNYDNQGKNKVRVDNISAMIANSYIRSSFDVDLAYHNSFNGLAEGDLDLKQWCSFLKIDTLASMSGSVKGKIVFSGKADQHFDIGTLKGSLELSDVGMLFPKKNIRLEHISGLISGSDQSLVIKELRAEYNQTKFKGKALIPISGENEKIIIMELDIPEFKTVNWSSNEQSEGRITLPLPAGWDLKARIKIGRYIQKDFNASEVDAQVYLHENQIDLEQVRFETMEGISQGEGMVIFPGEGGIKLSLKASCKGINLKSLFKDLNDFGQKTLTHANISGIAEAKVYFKAKWDTQLMVIDSSIETQAQIKVKNGELKDFSPLFSLSDYIEIQELKHIKFSDLENQISIKDKKIMIPEMEIKSTALNLKCSGLHHFNQNIEYRFSVLLNDILYKRYRTSKKIGDAFGKYEEELPEKNTRIEIHMSGSVSQPKFQIDKKALKKEFFREIKEEGKSIKKLFSDEIKGRNHSENGKKWSFEKSEQIFELEGETASPGGKTTSNKKPETQKFSGQNTDVKKEKKKNKFNFNDSEKSNPDYN